MNNAENCQSFNHYKDDPFRIGPRSPHKDQTIHTMVVSKFSSDTVFLYPVDCENPADHIHKWYPSCAGQESGYCGKGYGGATLTFHLESGEVLNLQGPWHVGADALFEETGVDIRDKCKTFVVIAKKKICTDMMTPGEAMIYKDIVWIDDKIQISEHDRGEKILEEMLELHKVPLAYYFIKSGGGRYAEEFPKNLSAEQRTEMRATVWVDTKNKRKSF